MMLFERWVIVILTVIVFGIWVYEVVFTPLPKAKKKRSPQKDEDLWEKLAAMLQDNLPRKD